MITTVVRVVALRLWRLARWGGAVLLVFSPFLAGAVLASDLPLPREQADLLSISCGWIGFGVLIALVTARAPRPGVPPTRRWRVFHALGLAK